ncbi:ribosomal protein S18-alanine N-acetyltransferase [Desulfurococcus amylolyticus]|nr:ribosomal protein S18-alanine N-acetyltransferase [Desulfurococcus amylolyticus]
MPDSLSAVLMREASADQCPNPLIRDFREQDLDEVVEIDKECFEELIRYDRSVFESILSEHDGNIIFYVAACNNELVGYALSIVEDNVCHLYSIAVRRMMRGRGIGSKLLIRVIDECVKRGCGTMLLEVATDNADAISFYLGHGFKIVGFIKGYYYGIKDAYVMGRILGGKRVSIHG